MTGGPKQIALIGAGVAVAVLGAKLIAKAAARLLSSLDKYEGLDGAVSYSSRKIAGASVL